MIGNDGGRDGRRQAAARARASRPRLKAAVLFASAAIGAVAAADAAVPANPQSCSACFRASDPLACHQVAVGLAMSRAWEAAIAIEEQVHLALPSNAEVAAALARMHQDGTRNSPRAIALYHAALGARSGYPPALLGLGNLMDERGETEIAVRYFERAARENPDEPLFKIRLAESLVRGGREAEAGPVLREIVQRWPETPEAATAKRLMPRTALAKP